MMKIKANDLRRIVLEVFGNESGADEIVKRCKAKSAKVPGFSSIALESKEPEPGSAKWRDHEPANRMVGKDRQDALEQRLGLDKIGKHKDAEETWPEIDCPFDKAGI